MDETTGRPYATDSLGAELRKQREIRGISLKEIADATKISRRYLEALEKDDHEILPAPVFTRGFVREFARHIGLDAEEMADRYNALVTPEADGTDEDGLSHSQPLPLVRVDRNLVVFALMLLAFCIVVWWVWSNMGVSSDESVPVAATATIEPAAPPPSVESPADLEPVPDSAETESSTLELGISVNEDTWVILQIDGEAATNEVLRAGDTRTFSANDEFVFEVIGNAGGLDLTLNGRPVAPLGARGRVVRNVVFDWKTLEGLAGEAGRDDT